MYKNLSLPPPTLGHFPWLSPTLAAYSPTSHIFSHQSPTSQSLITPPHRADCVVSDPLECENEKRHLGKVLKMNGYPENVLSSKKLSRDESTSSKDNAHVEQKRTPPVVIPYVKGVSEHIRRVLHRYNVQAFFKPVNTLRQFLVRPKDPIDKQRVIGPVYQIKCNDCDASYVGETERSLKARFMEHRRPSSTGSEVSGHLHSDQEGHDISIEDTKMLCVESKYFERGVKEAIQIRRLRPSLNRDGGRHTLPSIWNNVLTLQGGGTCSWELPRANSDDLWRHSVVIKAREFAESSM